MLNRKQKRILEFIKFNLVENDQAPTIAEIGREFGMSSSGSVHANLRKLEVEGVIRRSRQHRGIELVQHSLTVANELMVAGREG